MTPGSIEDFLPFSTNGVAIASDGSIWLYHPPSPGGMVELEAPVTPMPPVNTVPPDIQILTDLVVGSQLALTTGTWNPSGTVTRQWTRGGTNIAEATAPGYTLAAADVGTMIGGVISVENQDGSASATAPAVGPILAAPPLDPEQQPTQEPPTLLPSRAAPPRSRHKPHAKPPKRRY
jgi:hypothetical protein